MDRKLIPVACTLSAVDTEAQAAEWTELVALARGVERVAGGAVLTFGPELGGRVRDLAAREAACCAFLSITTEQTGQGVTVEITAPDPAALSIIESLAGLSEP